MRQSERNVNFALNQVYDVLDIHVTTNTEQYFYFLAFDFVGSAWAFVFFFIPATTANDLRLRRIFYRRLYPLHLFSYLNS